MTFDCGINAKIVMLSSALLLSKTPSMIQDTS